MADLSKGVLAEAWSLLVGWVLPLFVVLQLAAVMVAPAIDDDAVASFVSGSLADRQLRLTFVAVVVGLLLYTLQTQLYKVLEGLWLWPPRVREWRRERHEELRAGMLAEAEANPNRYASLRYPLEGHSVLPTSFGNAIRRFETYGDDRYNLDTVQLFHHLAASAPEYVQKACDRARSGVDFAVCGCWATGFATVGAVLLMLAGYDDRGVIWFAVIAAVATPLAYRMAVVATDEWSMTVQALVDFGRPGAAAAFSMAIPAELDHERVMWRHINQLNRVPFATMTDVNREWVDYFRALARESDED